MASTNSSSQQTLSISHILYISPFLEYLSKKNNKEKGIVIVILGNRGIV